MTPTEPAMDVADLRLSTVTRGQGNNSALKQGELATPGLRFEFVEVQPLVSAFRRMVRELEFDVCEMAFTTYLCAKEHGKPFTALPIFLVRDFHHGTILHNVRAGIEHPKDLEGRRVGVNRGYTVTTGVWARGILQDEYGVDLSTITWVLSGDEHVAEYEPPENVVGIAPDQDLAEMVTTGELVATIGVKVDHPDVAPLIADPTETAFAALREQGLYPINHLIVVRDELLEARPELADQIFRAFAEAKDRYVTALREDAIPEPTPADATYRRVLEILEDPLPYGIEGNRDMIDRLIRHAVEQHILRERPSLDAVFAPGTHELVG
jgi:4,5-dihydroxyphthalate decarboxylase